MHGNLQLFALLHVPVPYKALSIPWWLENCWRQYYQLGVGEQQKNEKPEFT